MEGKSTADGTIELITKMGNIRNGLALGGEGLNEVTARKISFGQPCFYDTFNEAIEGLERTGGDCAINHFIYGELARGFVWGSIGYKEYHGNQWMNYTEEDLAIRRQVHADHHGIPTINLGLTEVEELKNPSESLAEVLEQAT